MANMLPTRIAPSVVLMYVSSPILMCSGVRLVMSRSVGAGESDRMRRKENSAPSEAALYKGLG